jgi:hypothetical protein
MPTAASAGGIVVKRREAGKDSVADYWTPERIAAARPLEAVRDEEGRITVRRGDPQPFNHPANFESGNVPNPATPPHTVDGKLYGKMKGFGAYECSATSVDAPNRNLIMTAGHCVAEPSTRGIASKLAFIPSYQDGNRPFGTWVFDRIVVLRSWRRNRNFNFDVAAVELAPQNGVNLEDAVGGVPVATRLPADQTYYAVGYPENFDDGQTMRYCLSGFEGYDPHPITRGPRPIAMGCDMSFGASGGGWFVGDGSLNSVTSFGYDDHPDIQYGPYFGMKAAQVYAKGGS